MARPWYNDQCNTSASPTGGYNHTNKIFFLATSIAICKSLKPWILTQWWPVSVCPNELLHFLKQLNNHPPLSQMLNFLYLFYFSPAVKPTRRLLLEGAKADHDKHVHCIYLSVRALCSAVLVWCLATCFLIGSRDDWHEDPRLKTSLWTFSRLKMSPPFPLSWRCHIPWSLEADVRRPKSLNGRLCAKERSWLGFNLIYMAPASF